MGRRFDPKDRFFQKAKSDGYRARSAYKVKEICDRHNLLRKGGAVLDLGAAPGGFLQVIAEAVGPSGRAVGVDLQAIRSLPQPWVATLQASVEDPDLVERIRALQAGAFHVIVSDMAPATTGAAPTDVARSIGLVDRALELAGELLRPGGSFVAKVFMGAGFEELVEEVKARFGTVRIMRPEAVRSRSRECYIVALKYRPQGENAEEGPGSTQG